MVSSKLINDPIKHLEKKNNNKEIVENEVVYTSQKEYNQTKGTMKIDHIHVVKSTFSFPRKQVYLFIVSLLALTHFQGCLQSDIYEKEKNIMLELNQLWGFQKLWDSNSSHCSWYGIGCRNGSVTSISIQDVNNSTNPM